MASKNEIPDGPRMARFRFHSGTVGEIPRVGGVPETRCQDTKGRAIASENGH